MLGGAVIYAEVGVNTGDAVAVFMFWDSDGDGEADLAIYLPETNVTDISWTDVL